VITGVVTITQAGLGLLYAEGGTWERWESKEFGRFHAISAAPGRNVDNLLGIRTLRAGK